MRLPSSGRSALLTYELYYGLKQKPFSLSANPQFLYKSRSHAPVFDDLLTGIRRREGLIVLTGDIGTGKTTVCRAVLQALDRKTFSTFVPDPFVSREDLLKMLLIDFGVMSVDDLKSGRLTGASRPELSYPLYEFLNSLVPLQAFAVLLIDEAQNLSVPLLEEIRILSDLEAPEKLLQVVLVGQLELRSKLKLPEMRQVDQRVSVRRELQALNREGVEGYIAHRLAVAGGGTDRVRFAPSAVDCIFATSKGVPRIINLVCDRALHHGHLARATEIEADTVRTAIADLGLAEVPVAPPALPAGQHQSTPDLVHADQAILAKPAERDPLPDDEPDDAAPTVWTADDRPLTLFVKSRGTIVNEELSFPGAQRQPPARRFAQALGAFLLAAGVVFGILYWRDQEDGLKAPIMWPALPAPPPWAELRTATPMLTADIVPMTGPQQPLGSAIIGAGGATPDAPGLFAIDVALFNTAARADRLVQQLTAAGYHAYQNDLDLGARGHLLEVLVGMYATRYAAALDAERIREIPGYQDARVVGGP